MQQHHDGCTMGIKTRLVFCQSLIVPTRHLRIIIRRWQRWSPSQPMDHETAMIRRCLHALASQSTEGRTGLISYLTQPNLAPSPLIVVQGRTDQNGLDATAQNHTHHKSRNSVPLSIGTLWRNWAIVWYVIRGWTPHFALGLVGGHWPAATGEGGNKSLGVVTR